MMESVTDIFEFGKTKNYECNTKKQDDYDKDFTHCRIILDIFPNKNLPQITACGRIL
jgi:hypothetical protein